MNPISIDTFRRIVAVAVGIGAVNMILSSPVTAGQVPPTLVGWFLVVAAVFIWPKSRRRA